MRRVQETDVHVWAQSTQTSYDSRAHQTVACACDEQKRRAERRKFRRDIDFDDLTQPAGKHVGRHGP